MRSTCTCMCGTYTQKELNMKKKNYYRPSYMRTADRNIAISVIGLKNL